MVDLIQHSSLYCYCVSIAVCYNKVAETPVNQTLPTESGNSVVYYAALHPLPLLTLRIEMIDMIRSKNFRNKTTQVYRNHNLTN